MTRRMTTFSRDEIEAAFRAYWRAGAVGEDWDAWADRFTPDCLYVEHVYGTMRGRETVRTWIKPIMARYGELYTAYDWHVVDPERGRVIVAMQNRRDDPGGGPPIDFPGVTILDYAGDGLWAREEDYWSTRGREAAMRAWEAAAAAHPEAARGRTRHDWGCGPAWTRGGRSWAERPPVG
jgi:SnoaL-like protein